MNRYSRLDFLDYLRAFVILLVIVMHTALAYLPNWPDWVHNPQTNGWFVVIAIFAESGVLMPTMFFISGYFTLSSLARHGSADFLKNKAVRLGLPFLIGVFIVGPTLYALSYYSDGGTLNFIQAVSLWFSRGYVGQYHFWYLDVLLTFFVLTVMAVKRFPGLLKANPSKSHPPSRLVFGTIIAVNAVLCFAVNMVIPYTDWTILGLLQFQPVKVPLYISYFCLGIYAWKNGWFKEGYRPRLSPWIFIYVASFLFMLLLGLGTRLEPTTVIQKVLVNAAASVEVLSALMTCLALFQRLDSREHPWLQRVSRLSFNAYLVHLSVAFSVLYLTRDVAMSLPVKYALQATGVVGLSWGLAYGMSRMPGLLKRLSQRQAQVEEELRPKVTA